MNATLLSPLALMHPDGVADTIVGLGARCPAHLLGGTPLRGGGTPTPLLWPLDHPSKGGLGPLGGGTPSADLAIIAPAPAEIKQPHWLADAFKMVSTRLASDGVVCVLVPPRLRSAAAQFLGEHGFALETPCLHLPDWDASRYIVPLALGPARYAYTQLIPTQPLKRLAFTWLLRLPGGQQRLTRALPAITLIGRRGRPIFHWLFQDPAHIASDQGGQNPGHVITSTSWRTRRVSIVLHRFAPDKPGQPSAVPDIVAKIVDSAGESRGAACDMPPVCDTQAGPGFESRPTTTPTLSATNREAAVLTQIAPNAARAGARVPAVVRNMLLGKHEAVLETVVSGQTAAALLTGRPERLPNVLDQLALWLEAWGQLTRSAYEGAAACALLEATVLGPARLLCSRLPDGDKYLAWLIERCQNATLVPCVAAHNDLTLWNVIWDDRVPASTGIVDWHESSAKALPLVDLVYVIVDAVTVARRWTRPRAFEACFTPDGAFGPQTRTRLRRLVQALDVPTGLSDVCVHACFVGHAAHELAHSGLSTPKPFFDIAAWLASHRLELVQWLNS